MSSRTKARSRLSNLPPEVCAPLRGILRRYRGSPRQPTGSVYPECDFRLSSMSYRMTAGRPATSRAWVEYEQWDDLPKSRRSINGCQTNGRSLPWSLYCPTSRRRIPPLVCSSLEEDVHQRLQASRIRVALQVVLPKSVSFPAISHLSPSKK